MSEYTINDVTVTSVSLYRSVGSDLLRWDVIPFGALYIGIIGYGFLTNSNTNYASKTWTQRPELILLPIALGLHFFLFIWSNSSVVVKCRLGHKAAASIDSADTVLVKAAKNAGHDRIVDLVRPVFPSAIDASEPSNRKVSVVIFGREYVVPKCYFDFQRICYDFDTATGAFSRRAYPTIATVANMCQWMGHSVPSAEIAERIWGRNEFDIPLPTFMELYKEHMTAPFFVFQVLCLFLWSLDDYWYYSAMTLVMLMAFEGTLCRQRIASLQNLRDMQRPPIPVYCLRRSEGAGMIRTSASGSKKLGNTVSVGYTWQLVSSDALLPGDIISVVSEAPQHQNPMSLMRTAGGAVRSGGNKIESVVMPCDAVIIRGGCMVNEAMLTGESTPQVKEGISELILEIDCKDDLTGRPVRGDRIEVDLEGGVSAEGAFRVLPYDDHDCSRSSSEFKAISGDVSTRRHRLFAGTTVIQHSYGVALPSSSMSTAINSTSNSSPTINSTNNSSSTTSSKVSIPDSPDRGCIAVVTKTGFGTTQGELMRKILYASERVNVDSSETYVFIALLVCFAIIASVVVLKRGLADPDRNTFKVILHCIMIVTSVVPPELPMELSLAVTHSVVALSKMLVYCTEPFRISYAGRLNVLCFDKTGTLTQDKMQYRGIISSDVIDELAILEGKDVDVHRCCVVKAELMLDDAGGEKFSEMSGRDASPHKFVEINSSMVPSLCLAAMASCHSLVYDPRNSKLTGDPLELAAFESSKYLLSRDCMDAIALKSAPRAGTVVYADEVNTASSDYRKVEALVENIRILHKYPFSSALKMMSVLCRVNYHQSVLDDIDHGALVTSTAANDSTTATTATPRLSRSSEKYVVFTKGAPEVIATKLKQVPEFYRGTYLYHMGRGKRLLALACKILPIGTSSAGASASAMKAPWRDEVERDLVFLGFIAFDSDLKADSKSVVRALKNAGSKVVVITGDSAFTAADVAKKLRISSRVASDKESKGGSISGGSNRKGSGKSTTGADGGGSVAKEVPAPLSSVLLLIPTASNSGVRDGSGSHVEAMDASSSSLTATLPRLVWRVASLGDSSDALSDDTPLDVTSSVLADLSAKFTLCVTGPAMSVLSVLYPGTEVGTRDFHDTLKHLCPFITIFARVSPTQKEQIVQALNASGLYTLMCGDGTNDVGALRAAHVGISIVNNPELETLVESKSSGGRSGTRTSKSTGSSSATVGQDRLARALAEQELQELDPTLVKLGDASIASPFTSRRTSIDAVLSVMRQGRCTLVTMLQIFKVLALNCLCSAYFMSALYLRGLKQGDYQMTAAGLLTAGLFFFLSQAKPMPTLAPYAPPASVFSASVLYSIIGQFIVHIATVLLTVYMCDYFDMTTAGDDSVLQLDSVAAVSGGGGAYTASVLARQVHRRISIPDSAFHPNLLNSAMYIIGVLIQTNNFVVNYRGEPFTQSLVDNKPLLRSVQLIYLVLFIALTEVFTPLNDLLQLITFPNLNFKYALGGVCLANFALCFCIERMCRSLEQKALN